MHYFVLLILMHSCVRSVVSELVFHVTLLTLQEVVSTLAPRKADDGAGMQEEENSMRPWSYTAVPGGVPPGLCMCWQKLPCSIGTKCRALKKRRLLHA